jgi:hypothetical protein
MSSQDEQIQRLHYFDNQFLKAEDFTTEQEYHLEMRRRHNQVLHTKGVAEGLQIKKTSDRVITVQAGTAIDGYGKEIILLKDLPISLADKTDFPNNSTIYVSASYSEKRQKPQPDTSTDENQTTRFFENAVIKADKTAPDVNDKLMVRLGRFQLDQLGNVPDESQFFNTGFREEAAAKLPTFSISIQQLKTQVVAEGTQPIAAGAEFRVPTYSIGVSSTSQNIGAFLLVYAYSKNEEATFNWRQEYKTERLEGDSEFMHRQYVIFKNETRQQMNLQYKIYAVLES